MINISIWKNRLKKFIDYPPAIIPFLKKRLYYNFIADKQLRYYKDFKYFNYAQTINDIIDNNKSIIRFGDEIFDLLQGIGLYYGDWRQKYDKKLAKRLAEVLKSRDPRLLICFNPEFILKNKKGFKNEGIPEQYHFWTNSKIFLKNYYQKDITYGSALCFTPRYNKNIDYKKIKNYFAAKNIIIVTSGTDRLQCLSFGKTINLLEAPKSDAWQSYDEIKDRLMLLIKAKNFNPINTLILTSMASAAKILVYDLTKLGFTAWDTGQFFDLAFNKIKNIYSPTPND